MHHFDSLICFLITGTGFKLGSDPTEQNEAHGADSQPEQPPPSLMVLKMWRDGFSVDDGPLRKYDDPENEEFLASINRGEVPREIVRLARGGEAHLNMEDHRNEEFVEPKQQRKAFAGEGHRLGEVTP